MLEVLIVAGAVVGLGAFIGYAKSVREDYKGYYKKN